MRMRDAAMAAGLVWGLSFGTASAAPITQSYDFAFGFGQGILTSIQGSLTVTIDFSTGTGVLDRFSSNLPSQYLPAEFILRGNAITIGNECSIGVCYISSYHDRFSLYFLVDGAGRNPTQPEAGYSYAGSSGVYDATSAAVTLSAVPLPAAAPLFGAALMAFGAAGYGLKRKGRAVTAALSL